LSEINDNLGGAGAGGNSGVGAGGNGGEASAEDFLRLTKIAFDVGTSRIGVAKSFADSSIAFEFDTIHVEKYTFGRVEKNKLHKERKRKVHRDRELFLESANNALSLINDVRAEAIYIGLPLHLSSEWSDSCDFALDWGLSLKKITDLPIYYVDERLTTVSATRKLINLGKNSRFIKENVDMQAAKVILQFVLDSHGSVCLPIDEVINERR
jgi:putative transcription antitermination factor YqgF